MKKVVFALICAAGLATSAQAGDIKGWTKPQKNGTGGTTYNCDHDPTKICTSSQRNPNGTLSVMVRLYDDQGNMTGTITLVFPSVNPYEPNEEGGYIHEVPTLEYGLVWGKEVAQ